MQHGGEAALRTPLDGRGPGIGAGCLWVTLQVEDVHHAFPNRPASEDLLDRHPSHKAGEAAMNMLDMSFQFAYGGIESVLASAFARRHNSLVSPHVLHNRNVASPVSALFAFLALTAWFLPERSHLCINCGASVCSVVTAVRVARGSRCELAYNCATLAAGKPEETSMASENKIAAAILTASIAQRATNDLPLEEAPATIARLYTEFLTIVERSAAGERRTHDEWRTWVQQIMGVLPH
jgi:hypothetical protein